RSRCRTDAERKRDQGKSPKREHLPQHPDRLLLEPHILEGFCSTADQSGGCLSIATAGREVPLRGPRHCCMTGGRQLRETRLRRVENVIRLVEPTLLHERAAQHDLSVADLVEKIVAAAEELERVTRLLLCQLVFIRAEVDLRKR